MSEMNEGIKILIDRMQTNPEDFAPPYGGGRNYLGGNTWRELAVVVIEDKEVFTDEEKEAVSVALREVSRKNFTAKILEMLAAPTEDEATMQKYAFEESMRNTATIAGPFINTTTSALGVVPPKQRLQK